MSINERIKLLKSITCFSNMTTQYSEPRGKYKKSFHQSIKQNKDIILHYFEATPAYKELMPAILKNQRGNVFYKKLIQSHATSRQSAFFLNLMKAIKDVQKKDEEQNKREKSKIYYKVPKIDVLKEKKDKIESYKLKKNKTDGDEVKILRKSQSMINYPKMNTNHINNETGEIFFKSVNNFQTSNVNNATNLSNINDPIFSMDTLQTFNQNMESTKNNLKELSNYNLTKLSLAVKPRRNYVLSSTRKLSRRSIDLSEYFRKQERFIYKNNKKKNKILDKCERSLNYAREAEKEIEQTEKENKSSNIYMKFKNAMESDDKKIIENMDKGNKKYQEYQKIQEEKFMHLKKNIDIKLSDEYAYMIRNELQEIFGVNGTVLAYQLYSKDMTKLKEKISKNLENEKKTIRKVKDLLEDSYRKKEFLKYKVDTLRMKQEKLNQIKNFNFNKKDNLSKNADDEELKGNLLPKIVQLKDQCYQDIGYNIVK